MKRKPTVQEKRKTEPIQESKPRNNPAKNMIEVQAKYLRKLPEVSCFDFMKSMREWHRHALYKNLKDAEKAVEMLNKKDGLQIGSSPKKRLYEYRIKPKYE